MDVSVYSLETVPSTAWDERVQTHPSGCFYQTTGYARYAQRFFERSAVFLEIRESGMLVGQVLYFIGRPKVHVFLPPVFGRILKGLPLRTVSWAYGPLFFEKKQKEDALAALIHFIEKRDKPSSIEFTPAIYGSDDGPSTKSLLERLGFHAPPSAPIVANLTPDPQAVLDAVFKKNRSSLKRLESMGLELVDVETRAELEEFYRVYAETRSRASVPYAPFRMFEVLWDTPVARHHTKLFLLRKDGVALAAQMISFCGRVIQQTCISISTAALEKKIHGNDYLQWVVLQFAAKNGYAVQDMGGYEVQDLTSKKNSINHFKRRWTNHVIHYYAYSKTRPEWFGRLWRLYRRLKSGAQRPSDAPEPVQAVTAADRLVQRFGHPELVNELLVRAFAPDAAGQPDDARYVPAWEHVLSGRIGKDAFVHVVRRMRSDPGLRAESLFDVDYSDEQLEGLIRDWLDRNASFVHQRKQASKKACMGALLKSHPLIAPARLSLLFDRTLERFLDG